MAHHVLRTLTIVAMTLAVAPVLAQSGSRPPEPVEVVLPEALPTAPEVVIDESAAPLSPIPASPHDALPLLTNYPAITESSGTWLRRGLWYADIDAVIMARTWDRNGVTFALEFDGVTNQAVGQINAINFQNSVAIQSGGLGESSPGYDASARLALGRFLFRDQNNRDHTVEMVVFGGSEWNESLGFEAQLNDADGLVLPVDTDNNPITPPLLINQQSGLHVPRGVDGSVPLDQDAIQGFTSFDRAQTFDIEYTSRFHSWEWNYGVTQRMRKDRMELQPNGEWIRRASSGLTWEYTAGFRYFDVEERLDWFATDIDSLRETVDQTADDVNGAYNIATSNNLFGIQLGAGITYESDRWNVTLSTKQGAYINDARATTSLQFVDPLNDASVLANNFTTDLHENGLSYIGTGSLIARYYLRPNFSLRMGWEFTYVTGLALAPNQANFNPAVAQLNLTGDSFYHGVSFGSEYYW